MKTIALKPQKLTPEGFSQFGEVVSAASNDFFTINNGFARKYANLANLRKLTIFTKKYDFDAK